MPGLCAVMRIILICAFCAMGISYFIHLALCFSCSLWRFCLKDACIDVSLLQALHVLQQVHSHHVIVIMLVKPFLVLIYCCPSRILVRLLSFFGYIAISRILASSSIPFRPSTRPTTSHRIPRTRLKASHLANPLVNVHPIFVIVFFVVQFPLGATASPAFPLIVCIVVAIRQDVDDGVVHDFLTFCGLCVACAGCGVDRGNLVGKVGDYVVAA